ncbi:hypothetical protein N7G274_006694 [Stereocaulon virgatum]|uniref:Uncharacterized protein n=1 Tax=Stereocaulon virgatum TaxID=373712 RepID=A0ABR4A4F6_9LECA
MSTITLPVRSIQPRACYASLSRELKDEIWSYLLVTQFCASYTKTGGVEVFDNNIEHSLNLFCHPDKYIAQEARTAFYLNNTIRLSISALPGFLSSSGHITRTYTSNFDAALWVKRLIIHIELCNPHGETDASSSAFYAQQLQKLLNCPELRVLVLDVEKEDGPFPLSNCKEILVALKKKLGKGLRIYYDMGWSYGNPPVSSDWREDISGAYERDVSDPAKVESGE